MVSKSKKIIVAVFAACFAFVITGCFSPEKINDYLNGKEACYLNAENVSQFFYKGTEYTILEECISNGELGAWIGYIRKFAAVDKNGKVLVQENIEPAAMMSLKDLADKAPDAVACISFLNVYSAPHADTYLIVDVNGGYHKAVMTTRRKESERIFNFNETRRSMSGKFTVNPQNTTQLFCDGAIYQVTSNRVPEDTLGSFLDVIAESITFDAKTKLPLSKADLNKIDWSGKESTGQKREQWAYGEVYEICGTDTAEAVAVNINNRYYLARRP